MQAIEFIADGDGAWPDLHQKNAGGELYHLANDVVYKLAYLPKGMTSGLPSVALRIDLPDGKVVMAEISARSWLAAAVMLRARASRDGVNLE